MRADRYGVVRRVVPIFVLLGLLGALLPVSPVAAATDRLPDLRVADISGLHIVTSGKRRLLRFTGTMINNGGGPFETRANRKSRSSPWVVDQIVYNSVGGFRRIRTAADMKYAGDGHDHFHVKQMMTYHLWGNQGTLRDSKIGFCFFDTNLINGRVARSPSHQVYRQSMCGKKSSLRTRNGISVGWGDKYPWNFAFQYIDITGLPAGTYTLRVAVDLFGYFKERSESNNCDWVRVRFGKTGKAIKVLARGNACLNDWSTSPYKADIVWARAAGISSGCGADMFCTNNLTTRGEAATFVQRGFKYPAATQDYFTDDAGNANEANINRLAEAGVASRCAPAKFCPLRKITRAQLASMIARALDLPPATQDYFDDDNGVQFEADINRLTEAGLTSGCAARKYCPTQGVGRGQLMGLLHRALVPPAP